MLRSPDWNLVTRYITLKSSKSLPLYLEVQWTIAPSCPLYWGFAFWKQRNMCMQHISIHVVDINWLAKDGGETGEQVALRLALAAGVSYIGGVYPVVGTFVCGVWNFNALRKCSEVTALQSEAVVERYIYYYAAKTPTISALPSKIVRMIDGC